MRKGDEKRQELLNAAERLFCSQGYEGTGVQDIMNATGLSKGGFYHHYTGKDEVLAALCERRADSAASFTAQALNAAGSPMARINAVLHGFIPLRREETAFIAMLLPAIVKPEGRALAITYQDALAGHFAPLLRAELAAGAAAEVIFPPVKDIENVLLHLINHCWLEVAAEIARANGEGRFPERAVLLHLLEKYRRTVEVLLEAPFGAVEIVRVEEVDEVVHAIADMK